MASHRPILFRALTWNLFHGRDFPPDPALRTRRSRLLRVTERNATHAQVNRPLRAPFAACLAGWEWDVALLQEAPPRWLAALATACRAHGALGLTSRNGLAPIRSALAWLSPDLIASNEGGSNMVLVRGPARIVAVQRHELTRVPERRALLLARVELDGGLPLTVACMHLSVPDTGRGAGEAEHAARLASDFAAGGPLLFGGDLNLRPSRHGAAFEGLERRFGLAAPTAPTAIDHLLARGAAVDRAPRALASTQREVAGPGSTRLRLSDHAPVRAQFAIG